MKTMIMVNKQEENEKKKQNELSKYQYMECTG